MRSAVILCAASLACGSRTELNATDAADSSVPDAPHDAPHDARDAPLDAEPDVAPFDAGTIFLGQLVFYRDTTQGGDSGSAGDGCYFQGDFFASATKVTSGCVLSGWDSCTLYECSVGTNPFGALSAGTLTLSGPTNPSTGPTVTLGPQGYVAYYPTLFDDGDLFGVSASGAQVPAFAEQKVTMPGMIALTAPSSIPTTQDLTLTWVGGEANARVFIDVEEAVTTKSGTALAANCYFDAQSGSGVVPKDLLAKFQGLGGGYIFWGHERDTIFNAGSYPIRLSAYQYAYHPATYF